jgi:hypothetical protein
MRKDHRQRSRPLLTIYDLSRTGLTAHRKQDHRADERVATEIIPGSINQRKEMVYEQSFDL